MKSLIGEQDDPMERQILKDEWYRRVRDEGGKSRIIWSKKKLFLRNLPSHGMNDQFDNKYQRKPANDHRITTAGNNKFFLKFKVNRNAGTDVEIYVVITIIRVKIFSFKT